jgi:glycine/D-amino acid oxidase-like deaminating enzyme
VHGLSTAYYLAKNHGMTNVAVLDKAYIGGGARVATPPSCGRTT